MRRLIRHREAIDASQNADAAVVGDAYVYSDARRCAPPVVAASGELAEDFSHEGFMLKWLK